MKKIIKNSIWTLAAAMLSFVSTGCLNSGEDEGTKTYDVTVQLEYPEGYAAQQGITVVMASQQSGTFEAQTDETGAASFTLIAGIYSVAATDVRADSGVKTILSGSISQTAVPVTAGDVIALQLTASATSQIIIKELYNGGCKKDDGTNFQYDRSVVLYNNSDMPASLKGLCVAMAGPYNAQAANPFYDGGKLIYDLGDNAWIPAADAFWTFGDTNEVIAPYENLVLAINGAVNNTTTVSNSIDLSNPSYWVLYDPEIGYTNTTYHPAPSENIPTSHYCKAYQRIGMGNAWSLSNTSPGFFLFMAPEGVDLAAWCQNTDNQDYTWSMGCYTIPTSWILDGIEVYAAANENNQKRLVASVDAGYVELTNYNGYTLYRNVDKDATEALEENAGKIIYGYSLGTADQPNGSTDPSGIDAEASIAAGAHIIYKDTNNSSSDFHQRSKSSLKK